jgi:hypothetical protein
MKKHLVVAAVMAAVFSAVPVFAGVNVFITPPPIPVPVLPPPPVSVMVLPPPPPGVVIGSPSDWFWDEDRGSWFYYDKHRHPHYDRRHGFVNDGRHFYLEGGRWSRARHDMGKHKGHDKDGHGNGRGHGHGRGHGRD